MIRDADFRPDDFASGSDSPSPSSQLLGLTSTMLSTSLSRAAWAPLSGIARSTQTVPSAGLLGATRRVHQRRYSSSSSKPPVPPSDGPRRMDTSAPAKNVNSSGEKSKVSRRRGKENGGRNVSKNGQQDAAFSNLPSVPSTQHRQPHDVHVASFFSIHRPISVTTTVPPTSSSEAFDALFSTKKFMKNEPEDVIFTLSNTAQSMESMAHGMESEDQFGQLQRSFASDADGELRMLDGQESKMTVEEYTRRLRPFHPPPPPVPMDMNANAESTAAFEAENQEEFSTYSTVLTIRESRHADGRKTYEASTGPFVRGDMEAPAGEQEGLTIDAPSDTAGMTYVERLRHNSSMHAISTKRRRKVKMKKHKFKKLMRRTRTLRRKLDKA
ncbi:hypothetical protein N7533_007380 [Penicillium manginii]|uniref:uncharacterized protein n=1 Tax=Penicillium manginii TaxID=203109 RepID=UPI002547859D|nr:uncharacterized protein N7533_007380 [Penicillium manginii]KAJ5750352.1 hypothetical protein N7533_007380 [Penicillium manginii]